MDFPFPSRTEEQRNKTNEAAEALRVAREAYLASLSTISLKDYMLASPGVVFDDSQDYTAEQEAYEDAFSELDFAIDVDGTLHSVAWVEGVNEAYYDVWGYDVRGNEVLIATMAPDTPVYYG